jgi:hypothetical protein
MDDQELWIAKSRARFDLVGIKVKLRGHLASYEGGEDFWKFVLPGSNEELNGIRPGDEVDPSAMPPAIARQIDAILIDWLTQAQRSEELIARLYSATNELQLLHEQYIASDRYNPDEDILELHLETVEDLRSEITDPENRETVLKLIDVIRKRLQPGISETQNGKPIGLG